MMMKAKPPKIRWSNGLASVDGKLSALLHGEYYRRWLPVATYTYVNEFTQCTLNQDNKKEDEENGHTFKSWSSAVLYGNIFIAYVDLRFSSIFHESGLNFPAANLRKVHGGSRFLRSLPVIPSFCDCRAALKNSEKSVKRRRRPERVQNR